MIDYIGFTGTRQGMTPVQQIKFAAFMETQLPFEQFHHGDCVGADEQAHSLVRGLPGDHIIVVHPPLDEKYRAFCDGDDILEPFEYLERNHHIVDASQRLVACPKGPKEQRSGTWATWRYAKRTNRCVLTVISPDGRTQTEDPF